MESSGFKTWKGPSCSAAMLLTRSWESKYNSLSLFLLSNLLMLPAIGGTQQDLANGRLWILSGQMNLSRGMSTDGKEVREDLGGEGET